MHENIEVEIVDYLHTSHVFGTARKPYEMPIEADFGVHSSGHDPRQGLQKKELTTQGHIVSIFIV